MKPCSRKIRHATLQQAIKHRDELASRCHLRYVSAYYCKHCDGYHVGNDPEWKRKIKKKKLGLAHGHNI